MDPKSPALNVRRSINEPIREGLGTSELWSGPDRGLIGCWERGRQKRLEKPELAERAERGELVMLVWRGGVTEKLKGDKQKFGSLPYLATWQGLRGENLDINFDCEITIICSNTGQAVTFTQKMPLDDDGE